MYHVHLVYKGYVPCTYVSDTCLYLLLLLLLLYYTIYTITILYYTMTARDDRIAASVIREAKGPKKEPKEKIPAIKAIVCRCGCDSCDGTEDCDCDDCCDDCACEARA